MAPPATESQPAPTKASPPAVAVPVWLIAGLLALVTVAVYWPATGDDFINHDDPLYVTENPHVLAGMTWENVAWAFRSGYFVNWHPLTWLSHMLDVQLFGLKPGRHHLTSVLFHAANATVLFLVLHRLTGATWRSAAVAALFALHPLHVESVAWVSERKDVLSGFFFMLTLWAYAGYVRGSNRRSLSSNQWSVTSDQTSRALARGDLRSLITGNRSLLYLLSLLYFALALMSKAMVVTLPCVLLLLDYWPLRRLQLNTQHSTLNTLRALFLEKVPFFALAVISTYVGILLMHQSGVTNESPEVGFADRLVRVFVGYDHYLVKTIWPAGLALPYPRPSHWPLGPTAWIIGLSVAAIWWSRRRPYVPVGWFWFLGMLVPVIGFVPVGWAFVADRYTYLPLIGLFIVLVWGAYELIRSWRYHAITLVVAGSAVLVLCIGLTRQQLGYWKDSESLFRRTLEVTENNYLAHNNLGIALRVKGQLDAAITEFQEALRLKPDVAETRNNLGAALDEAGRADEAISQFQETLRQQPDYIDARYNLGNAFEAKGQLDRAISQFEEVLRLKSDWFPAHLALARLLSSTVRLRDAAFHMEEFLRTCPRVQLETTNGPVRKAALGSLNNLAWLLTTRPQAEDRDGVRAVLFAERACELTHYQRTIMVGTLAAAYAEAGRFPEAVRTAERAVFLATQTGDQTLLARNQQLLELYRAGRPYHDPAAPVQSAPATSQL